MSFIAIVGSPLANVICLSTFTVGNVQDCSYQGIRATGMNICHCVGSAQTVVLCQFVDLLCTGTINIGSAASAHTSTLTDCDFTNVHAATAINFNSVTTAIGTSVCTRIQVNTFSSATLLINDTQFAGSSATLTNSNFNTLE